MCSSLFTTGTLIVRYICSLARAKLLIVTTTVAFPRFTFELLNECYLQRDVDAARDRFLGNASVESTGVRVRILKDYQRVITTFLDCY